MKSTAGETVGAWLCRAAARLRDAGLDEPRREARLLLGHALGLDAAALLRDRDQPIDAAPADALLHRRAAREPLALITGRQGFWTLDLAVSDATLVPRADSETLIAAATDVLPDREGVRRVLDLGTGTGCLLLAALTEFPGAFGVGIDLSPRAARLATDNARSNGLAARAAFLAGAWTAAVAARFDLVLCNPPYVETGAIASLMPEVARWEPLRALDGGPDGLGAFRTLLPRLPAVLTAGGVAVLELGAGQAPAVAALAGRAGFAHVECRPDLSGTDRAMVLRLPAEGIGRAGRND